MLMYCCTKSKIKYKGNMNLSFVLVLAIVASVAAFAPVGRSTRVAVSMSGDMMKSMPFLLKPKNLEGMIGGEAEFDPLGFAESFDPKWLREAELKHGRVSMLAVVGWLVQQAGIHLPSPDGLYDVANPIDAFFHVGPAVWGQIFVGIGAMESINHAGKMSMNDMHANSDREVGMFSAPIYGSAQLKGKSQKVIDDLKLKELKNGRLAMIAIGGLVHHTIISGSEVLGPFPNPAIWTMSAGTWN